MSIRLKLWIHTLIPILFITVFGIISMLWITYSQQRTLIHENLISNNRQLENEITFAANNFEKALSDHVNIKQFVNPARALFKMTDSIMGLKKTFQCEAISQLQQLLQKKNFDLVALYDLDGIVSYALEDTIFVTGPSKNNRTHYTPTAASVLHQCSSIQWQQDESYSNLPTKTDIPSNQLVEFSVEEGALVLTGVIPVKDRLFKDGEISLNPIGAIFLKQRLANDFMEKFTNKTSLAGDIFSLTGKNLAGSHVDQIKSLHINIKNKINENLFVEIDFGGRDYFMLIRTYYHHGKPAFLIASYNSKETVISNSKKVFILQVAGLIAGVIIATLIALFTGRIITVPIRKIINQMNEIANEKHFGGRVEVDSQDELGKLAEAFNKMAKILETRDFEISGYVNELDEMNKILTERGENLEKSVTGSENRYQVLSDQLTAIIKGTASVTGEQFFRSLVKNLAKALKVRYAFIGILKQDTLNEIQTLAFWDGKKFMDNFVCKADDGPCESTLKKKINFYPKDIQNLFPDNSRFKTWGVESYLGARLLDSAGKATGVLVVMDDKPMDDTINAESITTIFSTRAETELERLLAMNKLSNYAKELERSNAELTSFASMASHDLGEPLRKIIAFGNRLRNRLAGSDDESVYDINRMQVATIRMQELIEDLLNYAKVTTKAQPFKTVDFNKIINESLLNLEGSISESNGIVNVETLPMVEADPIQIRQLFQNLIGNALKYCEKGVVPLVHIFSQPLPDNKINIFVKDNGIGFEEKYVDRIFGLFQRLHGKSAYSGTGMGLAICKKIVERHGGTMTAESVLGKGATFIITLPKKQNPE